MGRVDKIKGDCPYPRKSFEVIDKYDIQFEEKIIADEAIAAELKEIGGKREFFLDDDMGMYELDDIVG